MSTATAGTADARGRANAAGRVRRLPRPGFSWSWGAPTLFAVANAIAVIIVSPGVNDIWAALARESAAGHGVGLTYWFSWFGGASTPASYSVLEPYLSHFVGARALGAVSAVAWTPLTWVALRDSRRPVPAVWIATVLVAANLWSGRVPFIFGTALAIAALLMLQRRRTVWTLVFAVLSSLGSPVSAAFLAIVLVAVFIVAPAYRRTCWVSLAALGASLLVVAVGFGAPGAQHFTFVELLSCAIPFALYLCTQPPPALKVTLWLALIASPLIYLIPNGLGSNFQRFAWYCLPPVVVAYAGRKAVVALASLLPIAVFAGIQTATDMVQAAAPTASAQYYATLASELDRIGAPLRNQRLEVVDDGTHTAAFTLLDHAMLARGWETQEDTSLNPVLHEPDLDAVSYKIWLQDNAVGFVAISHTERAASYEYTLVSKHRPDYLTPIWRDAQWTLFRVQRSDHIVNAPVTITHFSQSDLMIKVPCVCDFSVRVHYSKFLTAARQQATGGPDDPPVPTATIEDDGLGWTHMSVPAPGVYKLTGNLTDGLFR